jgi:2-C-methyl-D-erythritol 2,4-cyclodiphosphate synthase/2-C-methyl-D-erythritol 4-phosphate cytidylyltransferase
MTTDQITVVAGSDEVDQLEKLVARDNVQVTPGGGTRQESVWNGLQTVLGDDTIVLVHDGARPLISPALIVRCIESARQYGSGVAALQVVDALKTSRGQDNGGLTIAGDLDRVGVWAAQTPQAFTSGLLRDAHKLAIKDGFTGLDESSLVQRLSGASVRLVPGDRQNIKITTEQDLEFAARMTAPDSSSRIGIGYDIHRVAAGRPLWLGGVLIPSEFGLDGHSDADVVLHAICDSLLGAAALPDIGQMFPNTDPLYRGISSLKLLERVGAALAGQGWFVGNIDAMLIAEAPRIAPYLMEMKSAISNVLLTSHDRISVKATTNEGIGSLGAGDGIACHATASIFRRR